MTEAEKKALALVNDILEERQQAGRWKDKDYFHDLRRHSELAEALVRSIEAHDAFRQDVSDAVELAMIADAWSPAARIILKNHLSRFIIPKPVDPLSDALVEAIGIRPLDEREHKDLHQALAARGLKIVQEN